MNWGGFAAGFSHGFEGGVKIGTAFKDAAKQKKMDDIRAQGIAEAQAAREKAINDIITQQTEGPARAPAVNGLPAADQSSTAGAQPATDPQAEAVSRSSPTASPDAAAANTAAASMAPSPKLTVDTEDPTPITPQAQPSSKAAFKPTFEGDPGPDQPAQPKQQAKPATAGLPYFVNGKGYATREEARAAAEAQAPSELEIVHKYIVPKMQAQYIANGDVEKADALGKWAEQRDSQETMKIWGKAYRAAQSGNIEKAADHVFELYKRYDDGITPVSKETVKDKDGNITGFNVKLKDDKTGEERTQFIGQRELTEMGLSALSPPQMFELQYKRMTEADKARAQAAADNAKSARDFREKVILEDRKYAQDKEMEGVKQNNALEKLTIEKQLDAANASNKVKREVGAKVDALRAAGYSDEFINGALPGIIGVGEYKKATSPEEARRMAHSDRMKSDPMYSRKSADEQQAILDQDMKLIYGGVKPSAVQAPAAGGLPAGGKGVPVYDTQTGKVVYR